MKRKITKVTLPKKEGILYVPSLPEENVDKFEYFIYGKGWKKTKRFEVIEIDVPDVLDNPFYIKKYFDLYGESVVNDFLITNHSIYWKRHMLNISLQSDLTLEESELLKKMLKRWDELYEKYVDESVVQFYDYFDIFDIVKFDKHMDNVDKDYDSFACTYKGKPNYSLKKYLDEKHGIATRKMVEKL